MCDERFQTTGARKQLSSWLRGLVQVYPNFGSVSGSLTKFFRVSFVSLQHDLLYPVSHMILHESMTRHDHVSHD